MRKGDVFMANLNPVRGSEQGGARPVAVVQNDIGNARSGTTIVVPMTTREKAVLPTHVPTASDDCVGPSVLLAEQVRAVDKSRLLKRLGRLSDGTMVKLGEALKTSMDLRKEWE